MDDNRVLIFDTTLGDGERVPGCKIKLLKKSKCPSTRGFGVDVDRGGFPISARGIPIKW